MIKTGVSNYPRIAREGESQTLRQGITKFQAGSITKEALLEIEDQVTAEVISEQIETGLDLITDGQIRWEDPIHYFARSIPGFKITGLLRWFDTNTYYRQPLVQSELSWPGPISVRDFQFAKAKSTVPVKAILPGPFTFAKMVNDQHYRSLEKLSFTLAEILNQEAKSLEAAGATFIQFDEPFIVWDKANFPLFQRVMQRVTEGLKATLALYTYFGDVEGLYPAIQELPFQVFGLDFATNDRNFQILKQAAFTKALGFGFVDARNTRLETEAEIHEKLRTIFKVVPEDRLYVSPSHGLEFLPREIAKQKLQNMVRSISTLKEVVA